MAPNRSRSFCLQFTSLRRKEAKHSPGVACFACLVWAAWECYGLVVHLLTACGTRPGGPQQQAAPTWPEADAAWRMQRQHRLACVKRAAAQALHEACRACQAAGAACFEPQRAARQPVGRCVAIVISNTAQRAPPSKCERGPAPHLLAGSPPWPPLPPAQIPAGTA